MVGTILDYLIEYGDVPFSEMRFTEVDAAILCKFSYFRFDGIVAGPDENMPSVSLKEISLMANGDDIFEDGAYSKISRQMVELMLKGRRFSNLRIVCFEKFQDKETQTQFAAITFFTGPRRMFVVFRGTDSSLVGLKEDFNLLYMDKAKCHELAVDYLLKVSQRFNRKMYVGGHSKGGHLALYASMYMPSEVKERIHRIYSIDGLGLRPSSKIDGHFEEIEKKVYKLIPQSSLIGMMLESDDYYEVVKSLGVMLMQHNVYSWEVDGRRFTRIQKLKNGAVFVDDSLNGWIDSQDDENRQKFIDAIFSVIDAAEAEHLHDLVANGGHRLNQILSEMRGLDEETVIQVRKVFKAFVDVTNYYFRADVGGDIKHAGGKLVDSTKELAGNTKERIKRYFTTHI